MEMDISQYRSILVCVVPSQSAVMGSVCGVVSDDIWPQYERGSGGACMSGW